MRHSSDDEPDEFLDGILFVLDSDGLYLEVVGFLAYLEQGIS